MRWIIALLERIFNWEKTLPEPEVPVVIPPAPPIQPPVTVEPPKPKPTMTNQERLYQAAKSSLGKRMIITPGVPNIYGCASSMSGVLKAAGYAKLPKQGIPGTALLHETLMASGDFEEVTTYERGLILIYPSGQPGAVLAHGHVFVTGDHGLLSNDSDLGIWLEKWTLPEAIDYYHDKGKLRGYYLRWKG